MLFKLSLLISLVFIWLFFTAIKRRITSSFSNDLKRFEEACHTFALNPALPVGSMTDMCASITATRKSFEERTLSLPALVPKLLAMRCFILEMEFITSPLLLSHLDEDRFALACNELFAEKLPRAIKKAKASSLKPSLMLARAIERAEQAARDAGAADNTEPLFAYRRCAIAMAEMDNFVIYA